MFMSMIYLLFVGYGGLNFLLWTTKESHRCQSICDNNLWLNQIWVDTSFEKLSCYSTSFVYRHSFNFDQ